MRTAPYAWIALSATAAALLTAQLRRLAKARAVTPRSLQASGSRPPQGSRRVLLLGDSTGVGVGCESSRQSIAARLAGEHPGAHVTNLCVSGARVEDVLDIAAALPAEPVDLVIVLAGGNDVLRWTRLDRLQANTLALQRLLRARARHVVWAGMANLGRAPLFLPPFSWLLSARARRVSRLLHRCAQRSGVWFIDFFRDAPADPFSAQPALYYGSDGIHPSGAAYAWCYRAMRPAIARALGRTSA
jgi:lysophospholipase L1-like esterase